MPRGVLDIPCSLLEIQKLAWLLSGKIQDEELEDPLALRFEPHLYGPYSDRLRHLLNDLDGSYLQCNVRIHDARAEDPIAFRHERVAEVSSFLESTAKAYLPALESTSSLIQGFESPFGLELLGTVDWLIREGDVEPSASAVLKGIAEWPGGEQSARRKRKLFPRRAVELALDRLAPTVVPG